MKDIQATYSESSLVSSRWVLVLSSCSRLKCCLISVSNTAVTMYFLHARYWRQQDKHYKIKSKQILVSWNKWTLWSLSHLFQALFAEGTLGSVVQATLQAVFTESVATGCSHRLIKQPVLVSEMELSAGCSGWLHWVVQSDLQVQCRAASMSLGPNGTFLPHAQGTFQVIGVQQILRNMSAGFCFGGLVFGAFCHT